MRWSKQNVRKRDTRITVRQAPTGRDAYENGRSKSASTFTTIEFWGDVTDMKDNRGDINYLSANKRLSSRIIKITADSRSVDTVNESDTLTLDNSTDVFEVIDKYDDTFRYSSVIIAKYKG